MELVHQVTALCVVGALLTVTVKKYAPDMALLVTLAAVLLVLLALMAPLRQLIGFLQKLGERSGVSQAMLTPLYKTIGIALVVQMGSSLCRDAGESALAAALETAGCVCAVMVSLPLLESVLALLMGFLT